LTKDLAQDSRQPPSRGRGANRAQPPSIVPDTPVRRPERTGTKSAVREPVLFAAWDEVITMNRLNRESLERELNSFVRLVRLF